MTHGSLFSGIGGFDLVAAWVQWRNLFHCEINPFCQTVLKHHFPYAETYTDIKTTDFSVWRGRVDVLSGGFPCQPYSTAGKRKGKADDRHLWPEMLRAIREIQPRWIVGENVRGLTNWAKGMVFNEVQAEMEAEGYEVLPFLLPACGVGAPHRRDRIWFIAYSTDAGIKSVRREQKNSVLESIITSNSNVNQRSKGWLHQAQREKAAGYISTCDTWHDWRTWQDFPTKSPVCNRNDGIPGRLANLSFSKWRKASLEALGNAIVPHVAYNLFKTIEAYESMQLPNLFNITHIEEACV